jgi:Tol biopolymer transport system component
MRPIVTNQPQLLIDGRLLIAASWSPDGRWLAYLQFVRGVGRQIFVRAAQDGRFDGEPRQWSPSAFDQSQAEFSPDGRWMAYVSNDTGASDVYVQPFPGPGEKCRVSPSGGTNPAWSRNGRQLYFLTGNSEVVSMFAVDISTAGGFQSSALRLLFEGQNRIRVPLRSFDVTPDGQFIMSRRADLPDQPVTRLNVILGWAESLTQRVPGEK